MAIENLEQAQSFLDQFSQSVSTVVNTVAGAIVRVERHGEEHGWGGRHGHGRGRWQMGRSRVNHGSGVVIDAAQGHILTSYHVVSGTQDVRIQLSNGQTVDGKRIGKDPENDLALVKVDPAGLNLKDIRVGNSATLTVGSLTIALGNPDGNAVVATTGIVSAVNQTLRGPNGQLMYDLVQTSAMFNPGMSGGPLLNTRGELIGLNTASMGEAQGINLAISAATIQKIAPDLASYGVVRRPRLGIVGERQKIYEGLTAQYNLTQEFGVYVQNVVENTSAAHAGIQAGDIVIAAGGEVVTGLDSLTRILARFKLGDEMPVKLIRKLEIMELTVKLAGEGTNA